jgi:peptidoglycan-N-acetylglucosamine deacetylase
MRIVTLLILSLLFTTAAAQKIAITFDDAPMSNGPLFSGEERADRLIRTLRKHNVSQAAFFVITSQLDSAGMHRVRKYSNAGHLLANHSHSHQWIRSIGTANYIRDIQVADSILALQLPYKRWYRYPFLDEGRTKTSRDSIRTALADLKLMNGYITVDNYDWHLNGALRKALNAQRTVDYKQLKKVYIEHIWNSILFYDNVGKKVLGRSPKHVLLMHENDLAALFLDDLLKHIRSNGWKIISPEQAYQDPIASEVPDVLFNGQGRVGAIAFAKGMKPVDLVQPSEDEAYLDELLERSKVFGEKLEIEKVKN